MLSIWIMAALQVPSSVGCRCMNYITINYIEIKELHGPKGKTTGEQIKGKTTGEQID